jgi:hypothetical protein
MNIQKIKIKKTESVIHKALANILQNEQKTINKSSVLLTIVNIIFNKEHNTVLIYIKIFPEYIQYTITNTKIRLYKKKLYHILKHSIRKMPKLKFIIK